MVDSIAIEKPSRLEPISLVGIRREVVAEAEHAFGNLFHRLHYFAQKLEAQGIEGAASLEGTVGELEALLRLILDYASPLAVELRVLPAEVILESIGTTLGCAVVGSSEGIAGQLVLADPGNLSEAFRLMAAALTPSEGGLDLVANMEEDAEARWLKVEGFEAGSGIARGRSLIAWALAQKLIEAQGGTLTSTLEGGRGRWSVRLPVPAE